MSSSSLGRLAMRRASSGSLDGGPALATVSSSSATSQQQQQQQHRSAAAPPPGALPPIGPGRLGGGGGRGRGPKKRDFSPLSWEGFFDSINDVRVPRTGDVFRCYRRHSRSSAGAADGGASSTASAAPAAPAPAGANPVLVCLHGGGYSSLTWAVFAREITAMCAVRVLCVDLRGHGHTRTSNDHALGAEQMCRDVADVVGELYGDEPMRPPLILVGHSMGGAIAVHLATRALLSNLVGLVVLDVVEGTAMESLSAMKGILRSRPRHFKSMQTAIEWSMRSEHSHNLEAARVSMPGQVCLASELAARNGSEATASVDDGNGDGDGDGGDGGGGGGGGGGSAAAAADKNHAIGTIAEDEVDGEEQEAGSSSSSGTGTKRGRAQVGGLAAWGGQEGARKATALSGAGPVRALPIPALSGGGGGGGGEDGGGAERVVWRTDLFRSERFWEEWFRDLTCNFLRAPAAKLLVLAGVDRLDKEMTIAHMQGKFQLGVMGENCGHAVQEDKPKKTCELVASFLVRNRFTSPIEGGGFKRIMPGC